MAAQHSRTRTYIFSSCGFFFLLFYFLAHSQRSDIGCLPYFHTWCGLGANLECMSEMCWKRLADKYRTQKWRKNSPSGYHRTTLSGYIFPTKANIDNRTNLVKQQYLPHMTLQYGELRPTSGWDLSLVWGTPANFNGFRVMAALLHGTPAVGVSQTLRRWTEGASYIRQGGHHVGHRPTF